jgi:hypothetical protein
MGILLGGGPSWADIVTAVGTALLALFAIATTGFAAAAFRAQSSQLRSEQRERLREAGERRRAQAVQVYVWQTPPTTPLQRGGGPETSRTASLVNSSQQPVYDVTIRWMTGGVLRGAAVREEPLKPGEVQTAVTTSDTVTDLDGVVAVAFFRDRAGLRWRTYADGRLEEDNPAPAATASGSSAR